MDIFLIHENGVDCALKLRQLDKNVNLIFLTTSSEFGVKSYDVRAADYIVKPATLEKLSRALHYCKIAKFENEPSITLTTKQQPLEIVLDHILYADFQNRSACIHLKDCLIPVSGSFTELSSQLTVYPQFMSCFKGIVVNLKQVREVCGDCLILKNGEQLPVSRRLQRQVQQKRLSLSAGTLRGGLKQLFMLILTTLLLCSTLAPTVLGADTPQVLTVSPSAITLACFDEPDRMDAVAFPLGTSQEELVDWFADVFAGFTGYDTQGNSYDLISGSWSLDTVNTVTPGVYYTSVAPDLGEEFTLADGVSLPLQQCAVSIQTPGEPDINCCVSARGFLRFPWILSVNQREHLDEFCVWLRQDGGVWTQLNEGIWFTSDALQLSQHIFEYGSTYDLKVTYPGGQTGVLTLQYDGEICIMDYSEGDRDGGDVNSNDSSSNSQPASTTPAAPIESAPLYSNVSFSPESDDTSATLNTQTSVAVMNPVPSTTDNSSETLSQSQESSATLLESYSPTQTVISGMRLRDLCADEESVVFGSGDLTVSITSKLLLALDLSDSDTLSVSLTQPESNQIMLAVEASGKSVTELPGTILRLRYTPQSENAEITVQNDTGKQITEAAFDGEFLRFTVDSAGTFTILEETKTLASKKSLSPLLPVSVGLILTAGGILFFRRKLHA